MIHVRQQIRHAWKERLLTMEPQVPVWLGRRDPFMLTELPAIAVYSQSVTGRPTETSGILSMGGPSNRSMQRDMLIVNDICAAATDEVEDVLDTFAAQIEEAVDEDIFFTTENVRLTKNVALTSSDHRLARLPEGTTERQIGVLRMIFAVTYVTKTGTPNRAA